MSRCRSILISIVFVSLVHSSHAQYPTTPDIATGLSPMAVYNVGDVDNVNPTNGNLFLDIPLLTYPQRGNKLHLNFKIYYNDKAWFIIPAGTNSYSPNGYYQFGLWSWYSSNSPQVDDIGVYVARDQSLGFGDDQYISIATGGSNGDQYSVTTTLDGHYVRTPDGSKHYYGDDQQQSCSQIAGGAICPTTYSNIGNSYPATDSSGYFPLNFAPDSVGSTVGDLHPD